jgi:CBS domain-containing protein
MNEAHTGSVLVVDRGVLMGIFTERDVLQRIAEMRRDVDETRVSEVMSQNPVVAAPHHTVGRTLALMTQRRVRHLPVVRDGRILGVVSIGDLVWSITTDLRHEVHDLHTYIHGPVSQPAP